MQSSSKERNADPGKYEGSFAGSMSLWGEIGCKLMPERQNFLKNHGRRTVQETEARLLKVISMDIEIS